MRYATNDQQNDIRLAASLNSKLTPDASELAGERQLPSRTESLKLSWRSSVNHIQAVAAVAVVLCHWLFVHKAPLD